MTEENPTKVEQVVRSGEPVTGGVFNRLNQDVTNFIAAFAPEGGGIHAALWAAKAAMPAVSREGDLTLGSNTVKFTKVDDIRKALYPYLAEFGIMAYLSLVSSDESLQVAEEPWTQAQAILDGKVDRNGIIGDTGRPIRDGRIPQTRMWAWVEYTIRFVYILDGSEVVVGPVKGSAYDTNSDKATGKATTAAIKRILAETFDIVDEKELDGDSENHEDDNRAATTDRRTAQEGQDRGAQSRSAAAPGATARPGRPSRSGPKKAETPAPAAEEKPEAPQEPATPPQEPAPAPEAPVEPEPPAEASQEPQQPSDEAIAAVDQATGEVVEETPAPAVEPATPPAPPTAPMPDALAAAKNRVKEANAKLGLTKAEVDAIAAEATGITAREEWITKGTAVAKLADALEARVAAL